MAVVLDSDAAVGFLDGGDALHGAADEAIRGLIGSHPLLVSAVTYAEVLTGARLGRHDLEQVRGFFFELTSGILSWTWRSPRGRPSIALASDPCGCRMR